MNLRKITLAVLFAAISLSGIALFASAFQYPVFRWWSPVNTLLLFVFAILHGGQRYGWRRILLMFVTVSAVSLAFESYGVASGEVYGPYHYSDLLGPKFLGLVPYIIPVAWFMMMYASYLMAELIIPSGTASPASRRLLVAAAAGVAMTAWDLALDPMMSDVGHWVWEVPGPYFGIPLQNFWGWWLTTFTALAIYPILADFFFRQPVNTRAVPAVWAIYAYALSAVSTVWIDFAFDLSAPGLVGLFAMLPWVLISLVLAARLEPFPDAG